MKQSRGTCERYMPLQGKPLGNPCVLTGRDPPPTSGEARTSSNLRKDALDKGGEQGHTTYCIAAHVLQPQLPVSPTPRPGETVPESASCCRRPAARSTSLVIFWEAHIRPLHGSPSPEIFCSEAHKRPQHTTCPGSLQASSRNLSVKWKIKITSEMENQTLSSWPLVAARMRSATLQTQTA